ncbi:hypothetical protein Taro_020598 [Colocasia esculenta]|uniref:Pentatricopeptide repeat-containing protein n=1 Tax=Colocasia esculenta TaxID=4460 RepID=A0A843UWS5_COLES|nr:hypothetical protein [Colocasia esculenta]
MAGGDPRAQLVSAIAACPCVPAFRPILARLITAGLWRDRFVVARAVAFCATSAVDPGALDLAGVLFRHADAPSAFAYNAMIRGHSAGPTPPEALRLFRRMLRRGLFPDRFAFPFLLRACARSEHSAGLGDGESYHALLLKHGFGTDLHVQTSLLHMYASLGHVDVARQVFEEMPTRSTVTWNSILTGHAKMSETPEEGLLLFGEMAWAKVEMNEHTLVAALLCCAASGSLLFGKCVHGFITRRRDGPWSVELGSSLLRMYVKCGGLDGGRKVFQTLPSRDVSAWTAMIGGLAEHGHGPEALRLFDRMLTVERLNPDSVTFTSVLHACSHSGLVEEGLKVFNEMAVVHGVEPRVEHYGAMVDLLGRAGRVEEARSLIESMPFAPNQVVWGALLNSCLAGGGDELLGRHHHVLTEGLEGGALFVEISNAYAKVGRWEEVGKVRTGMAERGVRKARGCSCVDVHGRMHRFLVGDTRDAMAMDVCGSLGGIIVAQEPGPFTSFTTSFTALDDVVDAM